MALILAAIVMSPAFVVHWDWSLAKPELNNPIKTKLQLWMFWIIVQGVAWVLSAAYLAGTVFRFSKFFRRHFWNVTLILLIPATYVLIELLRHSGTGIPPANVGTFDISNLPRFGTIGVLLAVASVWLMYLIRGILIDESTQSGGIGIQRFVELREEVSRLLLIAAVILVLGTASTAGLRNAVNVAAGKNSFPEEYVVLYGAMNSIFLMMVYIPVQASFFFIGRLLRNGILKEAEASAESIKVWFENRQKIGDMLGLNFSQVSAFGAPLATLLPFLSALVSHLFSNK